MQRALIIGASGGIGTAVCEALRRRGTEVTALSRRTDGFDLADAASVEQALTLLRGPFDLILVATGILAAARGRPERALAEIDAAAMAQVFAVNAIGPALVLRHAARLLPPGRRAVVAVLTARVGSIGDNFLGGWYSYRASKAAANQIVRTGAIEIGRRHREAVVVALHPGTVETAFTAAYPDHPKVTPETAAANLLRVIDALMPADTGSFLDWAGKPVPW